MDDKRFDSLDESLKEKLRNCKEEKELPVSWTIPLIIYGITGLIT